MKSNEFQEQIHTFTAGARVWSIAFEVYKVYLLLSPEVLLCEESCLVQLLWLTEVCIKI